MVVLHLIAFKTVVIEDRLNTPNVMAKYFFSCRSPEPFIIMS